MSTKDQAKFLREEAKSPHSLYHQFLLAQSTNPDAHFLFFEGGEDPAFFVGHVLPHLKGREYHEFVCNGRDGVIKVHELCARDGRASDRSLFFIDKDHTDVLGLEEMLPFNVYQTEFYSFENYIVCKQVVRRFWTERLRLQSTDLRLSAYLADFDKLLASFSARMGVLMAMVLIGRGIEGRPKAKLNLNNVKLEKVIGIDPGNGRVRWLRNGGQHFLAASNMKESGVSVRGDELRRIYRNHLRGKEPKTYIRGKYELWFLVKFLAAAARSLSDKHNAKSSGLPRAMPGEMICPANCIDSLAPLAACPPALEQFLKARLPQSINNAQ